MTRELRLFYYLDKSRATGPVELERLVEMIRQGQLFALDLVYAEGDAKWRKLGEFEIFKDIFKEVSQNQLRDQQWVLLTKKPIERGKGFIQSGPFSTSIVQQRLASGSVRYTDYLWRKGMTGWKKISEIEEFQPAEKGAPHVSSNLLFETPPFPTETADNLLKNVLKKSFLPVEEQAPPEAVTPDLVQVPDATPVAKVAPVVKSVARSPRPVSPAKAVSAPQRQIGSKVFLWAIVTGCLAVIGGAALYSVKFSHRSDEVFSQVPVLPPSPQPIAKAEPELPPARVAKPEPVRPPTTLRLQVVDLKTDAAKLIIEADGTAAELPLKFLFTAYAGEVVDRHSVHKTFHRLLIKGKSEFYLNSFHLPQGAMTVHVELVAGLVQEKSFFYGTQDTKFKDRLRTYKKRMAYAYQEERNRLYLLTNQLAEYLQDFTAKTNTLQKGSGPWQLAANVFRSELDRLKSRDLKSDQNLDNACLWPVWLQLRDNIQDLVDRLKQNEFDRQSVDNVQKLKARVMRESLWR